MIIRPEEYLIDGMPPDEMLSSVLTEHSRNIPRLERLERYYRCDSDIFKRKRNPGMPNNKIAHPFARYIATVASGYLAGQPVTYSADENNDALQEIVSAYEKIDAASIDAENARRASIYGKSVEYVHIDQDTGEPHISTLKPQQAFVVYSDSHDAQPLFGVYVSRRTTMDGRDDGMNVWVMGKNRIDKYVCAALTAKEFQPVESIEHYFGGVPMVEYWNDEDERGDFEWVIPIIDAYDRLESDRINDKEQFTDKLLVLTGCTMSTDEMGRTPGQQLHEDKVLVIPDNGCKAEYLQGVLTESDVEVLRRAFEDDIHKLSMVPNLSDREFASNASGVAMKYKLLGLEQLTNIKERWFMEGLKTRLKLFANIMNVRGGGVLDMATVKISMTRSLPANILEIAQMLQAADTANAVSMETRVRMLHQSEGWTDEDVEAEVEKISIEKGMTVDDPTQSPPDFAMGDREREGVYG